MEKSPEAFRTISEVAEFLDTPAHVLRFWESRFPQIRPVKRAGGRRYYRPGDVALLVGIKRLLHDQGMTIRGVQKILREQGVRHVMALSPLGVASGAVLDVDQVVAATLAPAPEPDAPGTGTAPVTAQIIALDRVAVRSEGVEVARPANGPAAPAAEAPFVMVEEEAPGAAVLPIDAPAAQAAAVDDSRPAPGGTGAEDEDGPEEAAGAAPGATAAALLRRMARPVSAQDQRALRRLQTRLLDLRERLATAARRRVR